MFIFCFPLRWNKKKDVDPDEDCFVKFCESQLGRPHCAEERVRFFSIPETEALGPYAARYFGSKLWHGEQWYMQIDSHMSFAKKWDVTSIEMLQKAPSEKPVISHYPPPDGFDFEKEKNTPPMRICGAEFATSEIESQILRLSDCFVSLYTFCFDGFEFKNTVKRPDNYFGLHFCSV